MEPIATTVATLEPHTSANMAQATMPASASPPCRWPTRELAKSIMRRATPPWVRKLPARMKNGTAMISNFSMPVKSFRPTDWIGTVVIVKMNVRTVRPSAMEIGMPVNISATSSAKMMPALLVSAMPIRTARIAASVTVAARVLMCAGRARAAFIEPPGAAAGA